VKRGLDANVLVYAHVPAFAEHERVRRYLAGQLADPDVTLVVTPVVLHEFVHVVTDPRRFDPPVPMSEALAIARRYLDRTNVETIALDEDVVRRAFDLLERHHLGRKRVADALLAATLLRHGIAELVSCNPADFDDFEGLRVVDPSRAR
jgi:toxin-antitoxin system PIN domain toxin